MSERKIAYEKHPVSAERKAELRKQGYKIIDARFAPQCQKPVGEALRDDGPTVAEYVAAGYLASNYPPTGYSPRSTPEEIEAAIAAEMGSGEPVGDDVAALRAEYEAKLGKKPFMGWDADELRKRMAEAGE
jgi:hypothetical protein